VAFVEAMDELNNILDLDIEDQITTDINEKQKFLDECLLILKSQLEDYIDKNIPHFSSVGSKNDSTTINDINTSQLMTENMRNIETELLREKLKSESTQNSVLKTDLSRITGLLNGLRAEYEQLKDAMKNLEDKNFKLSFNLREREFSNAQKLVEIGIATDSNEAGFESQKQVFEDALKQKQKIISKYMRQIEDTENKYTKKIDQLNTVIEKQNNLLKDSQNVKNELVLRNNDFEELRKENEDLKASRQKLEQAVRQKNQHIDQADEFITSLQHELSSSRIECSNGRGDIFDQISNDRTSNKNCQTSVKSVKSRSMLAIETELIDLDSISSQISDKDLEETGVSACDIKSLQKITNLINAGVESVDKLAVKMANKATKPMTIDSETQTKERLTDRAIITNETLLSTDLNNTLMQQKVESLERSNSDLKKYIKLLDMTQSSTSNSSIFSGDQSFSNSSNSSTEEISTQKIINDLKMQLSNERIANKNLAKLINQIHINEANLRQRQNQAFFVKCDSKAIKNEQDIYDRNIENKSKSPKNISTHKIDWHNKFLNAEFRIKKLKEYIVSQKMAC